MEDQLAKLISALKEEKSRLQTRIEEFLSEEEYLFAHYHSTAVFKLNRQLQVLNKVADKHLYKKQRLEKHIEWLEKQIQQSLPDHIINYGKEELQRSREELHWLNQLPKHVTFSASHDLFDRTLGDLINKKIKNLRLTLKKSDKLFLTFRYSKNTLTIVLPGVQGHLKKGTLYPEIINSIQKLGFVLTQTRLTLSLTDQEKPLITKVKIILSRLIFDIFIFEEFENESYIQFTDKPSNK